MQKSKPPSALRKIEMLTSRGLLELAREQVEAYIEKTPDCPHGIIAQAEI